MNDTKKARAFNQEKPYAPGSSALSREELHDFLASPDSKWLIKIAFLDENGWPAVVPVWYQWDGTAFFVVGNTAEIGMGAAFKKRSSLCDLH